MSFADTDHLIVAEKALAMGFAILPIFEQVEPGDKRPRAALETLTSWMKGVATEADVRKATFEAQEASRETSSEAARFAARACGQAAAVAHTTFNLPHVERYVEKARSASN